LVSTPPSPVLVQAVLIALYFSEYSSPLSMGCTGHCVLCEYSFSSLPSCTSYLLQVQSRSIFILYQCQWISKYNFILGTSDTGYVVYCRYTQGGWVIEYGCIWRVHPPALVQTVLVTAGLYSSQPTFRLCWSWCTQRVQFYPNGHMVQVVPATLYLISTALSPRSSCI